MLLTLIALVALGGTPQDCVKSHPLTVMSWAPCTGVLLPPKDVAAGLKAFAKAKKLEALAETEKTAAEGRETVLRMERDAARTERDAQAAAAVLARKEAPLSWKRVGGVVVAGLAATVLGVLCAKGDNAGCVGSGLAAGVAVGLSF